MRATKHTMRRADFEMIALTIARLAHGPDRYLPLADRRFVADRFAHELALTNPAFDRARFLKACEVTNE